jgi:oligoribonuclease NrnB/cAMP/cGMP phosphodiesterase (DHH superfamily)
LKSIIISHESDVDGVFSASIALIRYPQSKILFTSYGRENFLKISQIIYNEVVSSKGQGQIIISDLGLNDDLIDLFEEMFTFLKSNLWSIIWIDHHPWSDKAIDLAIETGSVQLILDKSENICSSELIYEKFLKGNTIAEELSKIAHTTDFLTKDQEIPPLPELIVFYKTFTDFYLRIAKLTNKIAKGTLWDTEMQNDYNQYIKLREQAKAETFDKIKTFQTEDKLKVSLVPTSPYLQISLFSEEIFRKTNSDIAFFINKDGKVSIRRNNDAIHCNYIAKQLLEGGGHRFAAGGRLKSNPEEIDKVIMELKFAITNAMQS